MNFERLNSGSADKVPAMKDEDIKKKIEFEKVPAYMDAYKDAERFLNKNSVAINDKKFVDFYGQESIISDREKLKSIKAERGEGLVEEEGKAIADLVEATILHGLAESEWFGENIRATKTTEFDDNVEGVDIVAEVFDPKGAKESKFIALAVDATYANDLNKKIIRIGQEIRGVYKHKNDKASRSPLASVKYYIDIKGNVKNIKSVPKVVACCDIDTAENIGEKYWGRKDRCVGEVKDKKDLKDEQIKFQILEEALIQLDYFGRYAAKQDVVWSIEASEKYQHLYKDLLTVYEKSSREVDADGEPIIYKTRKMVKNPDGTLEKTSTGKPVVKEVSSYKLVDQGVRDKSFAQLINELSGLDPTLDIRRPYDQLQASVNQSI